MTTAEHFDLAVTAYQGSVAICPSDVATFNYFFLTDSSLRYYINSKVVRPFPASQVWNPMSCRMNKRAMTLNTNYIHSKMTAYFPFKAS